MDKYNLGTVGSGIVVTELWSGSVGSLTGMLVGTKITLNDDFTNYKFLVFDFCSGSDNGATKRCHSKVISVHQFINLFNNADTDTAISFCWGYNNSPDFFDISKNSTTKVLNTDSQYTQCTRILGIN